MTAVLDRPGATSVTGRRGIGSTALVELRPILAPELPARPWPGSAPSFERAAALASAFAARPGLLTQARPTPAKRPAPRPAPPAGLARPDAPAPPAGRPARPRPVGPSHEAAVAPPVPALGERAVPVAGAARRRPAPLAARVAVVPAMRARPLLFALLLSLGMAGIPLIALTAGGGAGAVAARPTVASGPPVASGQTAAPPARRPQATLLGAQAGAAPRPAPALLDTPLPLATAAPAALLRPRPAAPTPAVAIGPIPPVTATPVTHPVPVPAPAAPVRPVAPPVTRGSTAVSANAEQGLASWYNAPHGTCAHPTLPFGTVLTITDLTTGHTATCRVDDRGPYAGGRVVDLSPDVFAELAPLGVGVTSVRFTW